MTLPERYVGLTDVEPASLIEHAEQVQRNFEALHRSIPLAGLSPSLPSQQRVTMLTGIVSATGTILDAGTGGWTVARTGGAPVGDYTVTFDVAFASATQIAVLTPVGGISVPVFLARTVTTIVVQTFTLGGVLVDAITSFWVLGPR